MLYDRTFHVSDHESRKVVEQQLLKIDMPNATFEASRTVCNDLHNLGDEILIWRDPAVPRLDELTQYYSYDGIQLDVDGV